MSNINSEFLKEKYTVKHDFIIMLDNGNFRAEYDVIKEYFDELYRLVPEDFVEKYWENIFGYDYFAIYGNPFDANGMCPSGFDPLHSIKISEPSKTKKDLYDSFISTYNYDSDKFITTYLNPALKFSNNFKILNSMGYDELMYILKLKEFSISQDIFYKFNNQSDILNNYDMAKELFGIIKNSNNDHDKYMYNKIFKNFLENIDININRNNIENSIDFQI
jgi:hypothetical protein